MKLVISLQKKNTLLTPNFWKVTYESKDDWVYLESSKMSSHGACLYLFIIVLSNN